MKIGIIIDSSCGLSKKDAQKLGYNFLPLFLNIDDKEYADGENISVKEFYEIASIEKETRTSATPPGIIQDVIEKTLKENDHVIIYPLSQKLSTQKSNIEAIAKNYKNVHVINSMVVGRAIIKDLEQVPQLIKDQRTIEEIVTILNRESSLWIGFMVPSSLKWLIKGGRVSPKIGSMADYLKILPIIKFENGELSKFSKGRVLKKTFLKAVKFAKQASSNDKYVIYVGSIDNQDVILNETHKEINEYDIYRMPPVIATHSGPEVISIMTKKK